jgi:putative pre-16S rRNA nuclease
MEKNMKILALDTGDVWTGTALSDALGIIAKPFKTVKTEELVSFLQDLLKKESIQTIIVGHPKTLRGTQSEQTKKVEQLFNTLQQKFSILTWVLWDERFTSQQAAQLKQTKTKEDKIHSHSLAAAFILASYLEYRHFQNISS